MRIYTEVNYIWKDDKLIQTDAKSFDYEGEIELCNKKFYWHTHKSINDLKPKGGSTADLSNAISTGIKSGTTAITEGIKKINKDNPNPNLNLQTPKDFYDKTRDALHDAATNLSGFIDKNTDTISQFLDPDKGDDSVDSTDTSNNPLLEDSEPGTRRTASGRKYGASGRSTSGRRGIEQKKGLAPSLITQHMQKRLSA